MPSSERDKRLRAELAAELGWYPADLDDAATLASAFEWTIESRVNRLLGHFIEKMFGA